MKTVSNKICRCVLSVTLAICMVLGMAMTALATEVTEKEINYVSIGDSMTNGYCFEGYEQGSADIDFFNGVGVYGEGAYPLQFEEWLEGQGYTVNHTKLASSAMRAEDLNYLLGGREMPDDDWFNQVEMYTRESGADLALFYQDAVSNADIMTLCLGNASFGAYMLARVTDALGVMGSSIDPDDIVTLDMALEPLDAEQREFVMQCYNDMKLRFSEYIPVDLAEQYNVDYICDVVAYIIAGFLLNYEGTLDRIVELNPDVEIILIGLMNTTYGITFTMDGIDPIPVGDIMDDVFTALNMYIAGLPTAMQASGEWTDAKFYYAEQPNPLFIVQAFNDLLTSGWASIDGGRLSGTTVRERNITAYNDTLREMIAAAFSTEDFNLYLPKITLADVNAFEENNPNWAYADCGYGFTGNGDDAKNLSIAIYLGIESAVAVSTETMEIPVSGLKRITDLNSLMSVFSDFGVDVTDPDVTPIKVKDSLAAFMLSTPELRGMCKIYALFKVGNGMSVHPTPSGHDNIADAVIASYSGKYMAADATMANAKIVISVLSELIAEHHEEIYAYLAADPNVQATYADATTAEYVLSEDSYYVSLGDGSVLSEESTFGYKLAEEIGLDVDSQFAQLGIDGLRAEDILYLLDPTYVTDAYGLDITAGVDRDAYISEIKKADLITVGLGQNNISEFVMSQVMGYTVYELGLEDFIDATVPYELDWSHYVGEENVHYVDEELDKVYAELVANGVPESMPYEYAITSKISIEVEVPVAGILTYMVECYAYGYTGYAVTFARALNTIHKVNPYAEVITVGMYNPVEGLILDMNGTEVALGDYVNTIVDVSNGYCLVYAAMTPKTTFVDAPEVETYFDATGEVITMEAYLGNILAGGTDFNANENGHMYIKNMIFNSLTIKDKEDSLIGDINMDGKVNNIDATYALRYSVGGLTEAQLANLDINAGDVNSNGSVNNIDATIILRFSVGSVTVLPITA